VVCLGLLAITLTVRNIGVATLAVVVLAVSYAYSPRGYRVAGNSVAVRRLAGTARVELNGVREARRATPDDVRGSFRLWGSGGLFGYFGLFTTAKLGRCTWYVTDRSKSVVVITAAKTVLFSPDDPDGFLAAIRAGAQSTEPRA
jgi:hypothetical protein